MQSSRKNGEQTGSASPRPCAKREETIPDLLVVFAAGGSSTRFHANKLFAELDGIPVFLHAARAVSGILPPGAMTLSVRPELESDFRALAERFLPDVRLRFVHGGVTRAESVLHALEDAESRGFEFVAVHDAGRPMLTASLLRQAVDAARGFGGAIVCRKVVETVKRSAPDGTIAETIPRDELRIAETPQVFRFRELLTAYRSAAKAGCAVTDDAQAMELFSDAKIRLVDNPNPNPKITYPEDLEYCKRLLRP